MHTRLSRLRFLRLTALGLVAIPACAVPAPTATPVPAAKPAAPAPAAPATAAAPAPAPTKPAEPAKPADAPAPGAPAKPAEAAKPADAPKPAAPAPAAAAPKPAGQTTIKYLSWLWHEKGRDENYRTVVKQFHEAQSTYKIEEVGFPFSEFDTKIFAQAAGGRIDGDAMDFQPSTGVRLMVANSFAPMDPVIDKLGIRDKLEPGIAGFFLRNGKYMGLPHLGAPWGVFYNKELFEKEGIKEPATTPEQFIDYAKRLTKKPNQYGFALRSTMAERFGFFIDISDWVVGLEGKWVDGNKFQVNTEPIQKAVGYFKQLYDTSVPQGATASEYRRMNWEGKIAMAMEPAVVAATIQLGNAEHYEKRLGGASVPFAPKHRKLVGPTYTGVVDKSTQKDGAYAWHEFFHKPDIWSAMAKRAGDLFEPWKGAIDQEYVKTLPWAAGFVRGEGVVLDALYGVWVVNANQIQETILTHIGQVLTANKSPQDALAAAQKELEEASKGWTPL